MASNTKSSQHDAGKAELKKSNSNNKTSQQKQKPLIPASSLPSKPSFTKKTSGWAAIAASKSQEPAATSTTTSTTATTSTNPTKKSRSQQNNSSSGNHNIQRSNSKKSTSPKPLTSQADKSSSIEPNPKLQKPLNNFNRNEVMGFLTNRTEELMSNYPIVSYKPSGSEWSKLGNKYSKKNEKDIVQTELSKFLKH